MDRRLIFVSCGATTGPAIPALAARHTIVVPDAATANALRARGVAAVPWQAAADGVRLAAVGPTVAACLRAFEAALRRRGAELFAVAGRDRTDACLPAVLETLRARLAGILTVAEFGRALAATGRLAAVLVHEDVTAAARALLAATGAAGVPSVHVPHGVYVDERLVGADVHGTLAADVAAVGGPAQRDWFVRRGVARERIVVTGNPAWDAHCRVARAVTPGAPPLVVFAASWLGRGTPAHDLVRRQHERWTRAALAGVAALRAAGRPLVFVVKHHPSAPPAEVERLAALAARLGVRVDDVVTGAALPLLARATALVSLPSTIVIESVLAGTPVVVPELCYEGDAVLTTDATGEAVAAALGPVLDGWGTGADFAARREGFAARYDHPADGRAAERVAALVEDLAARALPAARRVDPGSAGDRARLGLALLERGDAASAQALFGEAAVLDAGCADAWCGLGLLSALRGDGARAAGLLERTLALDPAHAEARHALGALARAPAAAPPV